VSVFAVGCDSAPSGVETGEARRATVTEVVDAPAAVTARAAATLTTPADGTLASLAVEPGAHVTAGQVIGVVDSPTARKRLDDAQAALDAASQGGGGFGGGDLAGSQKRTDDAAKKAFGDARKAANQIADPALRGVLLTQVDAAEKQYTEIATQARQLVRAVQDGLASVSATMEALTAAQRTQARSAYDLARTTVDALTLKAPIDGVVQLGGTGSASAANPLSDLLASGAAGLTGGGAPSLPTAPGPNPAGTDPAPSVGARLPAGTAVATIVDLSQLGLTAEVDETDVLLIHPGLTANVELDAAPGARYEASVKSVDVLPTTSARGGVSYRVRLTLGSGKAGDGTDAPTPRPGMNAVAHLQARQAPDAVAVPASAVFGGRDGEAVWLVKDGRAERHPVRLGVQGEELVQVTDGLKVGDRVVVHGADKVTAGQKLP